MSKQQYKDGVYDISNELYHSSHGISRSQLMLFDKSPYHFWYQHLSGLATKKETTPSRIIGNLFHTLLLEPDAIKDEYLIKPVIGKLPEVGLLKDIGREKYDRQKDKRERQCAANKIILEQFERESIDRIIITQEQFDNTLIMANLVRKHEIVTTLLDESVFEKSIYWTDKDTGLQFKCRPDIWSEKMIVDVKTTKDASPGRFMSSAYQYGYYLQAGMAYEACQSLGKPFEMFVILAIEKEEPYVPSVFIMDGDALQFGIDQFQVYKQKLKECFNSGKWPGYPVQELSVPKYAVLNDGEE